MTEKYFEVEIRDQAAIAAQEREARHEKRRRKARRQARIKRGILVAILLVLVAVMIARALPGADSVEVPPATPTPTPAERVEVKETIHAVRLSTRRVRVGELAILPHNQIYMETLAFLTRLSARYSRLIAEPIAKLAGEVIDETEKANKIFPSDDQRKAMRKGHLLEALASLSALDVRLTHCYLILSQNPEGCFTTAQGRTLKAAEASEKLDKMAQSLGELIDAEQGLIRTVMDSDRKRK